MQRLVDVIFEDENLLVVNKPADLVCHPTKGDAYSSLISRVRLYLGKPLDVHLINRLDRETSGVVVVAKNLPSAAALRKIWEGREVRKEYWAIVHGAIREPRGIIDAPLGKDQKSRVAIKDCVRADGAPAQTEFMCQRIFVKNGREFSFLHLAPLTGRKHQIRIHLAHLGHPIVGDKLYGKDEDQYLALVERRLTDEHRKDLMLPYHALHACSICFVWGDVEKTFLASPEKWFLDFLNGD